MGKGERESGGGGGRKSSCVFISGEWRRGGELGKERNGELGIGIGVEGRGESERL